MNDNEQQSIVNLLERLVRLETRMVDLTESLKRIADGHEPRIRKLELDIANQPTKDDIQELRDFMMKVMGVVGLVSLVGFPTFMKLFQ